MSLLLIYWEQPQEALPLLQEAQQLAIQSPRIRCWLAAVEAEVYAHLDDANACDEALRTAKVLAARDPLGEDSYSTGFNPSRLAGFPWQPGLPSRPRSFRLVLRPALLKRT